MKQQHQRQREEDPRTVTVADFGRDHWSLLAYVETRCVDFKGTLDKEHLRCNTNRHPGLVGYRCASLTPPFNDDGTYKYPSRLREGALVAEGHDDWDCFYDLEAEGLIMDEGTGVQPLAVMTKEGLELCSRIRAHKAAGGGFGTFTS